MKVTNKHGLPEQIVNAVTYTQRPPKEKHISITGLIGPAWKRHLEIKHWDELTEDVSSRLWALLGQAVHWFLEKHSVVDAFAEERLYAEIGGWTVTGQSDSYNEKTKTVEDWKTTSVWQVVYKDRQIEWEQQLNCYAYLWRKNGFTVERLQVNMILRDWVESKAGANPEKYGTNYKQDNYPPIPFVTIDLPLWEQDRAEAYILERLKAHENIADNCPCSAEERWHKADTWAVMKEGRKSAVKLFTDIAEAEKYRQGFVKDTDKYSIEYRPGDDVRCKSYCAVKNFCSFYKELYEKKD